MLRIADNGFLPYEVSTVCVAVYQHMWKEKEEERRQMEESRTQIKTVIGRRPQSVSVEPLPPLCVERYGMNSRR
jgi:hypothetical protein